MFENELILKRKKGNTVSYSHSMRVAWLNSVARGCMADPNGGQPASC